MLRPTPLYGWLDSAIQTANTYWSAILVSGAIKLRHCAVRVLDATEETKLLEYYPAPKHDSSTLKAASSEPFKPSQQYNDYHGSFHEGFTSLDGYMSDGSEADTCYTDDEEDDDEDEDDDSLNRTALIEALHQEIDSLAMRIAGEMKKRAELESEVQVLNDTVSHMDVKMTSMADELAAKAQLIDERDATIKDLTAKLSHAQASPKAESRTTREASNVKNLISLWAKDKEGSKGDSQQTKSTSESTLASPKSEAKRETTDAEIQSWVSTLKQFIQAVEGVDDIQQRQNESLRAQVRDLNQLLALVDFDNVQGVQMASTRDRAFRRILTPDRELLEVYRVERQLQQKALQTALSPAVETPQ